MYKDTIMCRFFLLLILFVVNSKVCAEGYSYILNDSCIKKLYTSAVNYFNKEDVDILKDPYGLILRINLPDDLEINAGIVEKFEKIKYFLAKIKNPVIIEVHVGRDFENSFKSLTKWEVSTLLANKVETMILDFDLGLDKNRLKSVGYGEFFPARNTSYNGGNYINRIDIMILCNIIGE